MTDDQNMNADMPSNASDDQDPSAARDDSTDQDRMTGRSFAGSEYASTEREQTRDRERVAKQAPLDEAGEPADEVLDPQGDYSPRRRDPGR